MTWVTWRQHRSEAIGVLAVVGVLALALHLVGSPMRAEFGQDGMAGCVAAGARGGCVATIQDFLQKFGFTFNQVLISLVLLPGLIGVIVGAPLLGREFEQGTWRMAWSQTVPRTRWLAAKLALITAGLVVLGAALTAVFTWYRSPMDQLTGHLADSAAFDFEGVTFTAYLLCAFAFAVLAGLVMRRSVTAMVAAFFPWAIVRALDDFWLRAHFMRPLTLRLPQSAQIRFGPNMVPPMTGHLGDWVLGVTTTTRNQLVSYQPASRFWTFQLIDAGLYLALAAAALSITAWLLRRRAA